MLSGRPACMLHCVSVYMSHTTPPGLCPSPPLPSPPLALSQSELWMHRASDRRVQTKRGQTLSVSLQQDNINVFLRACGKLGLKEAQLFHPGDLQDLSSRVTVK